VIELSHCAILPIAKLEILATHLVAEFGHLYPDWDVSSAVAELSQDLGNGLPLHIAAVAGNMPIAVASVVSDDEVTGWEEKEWWLANVYVMPQHRGSGIGTQLITRAVDVAKNHGAKELHLVTDSAERWYEKHGWTTAGIGDVHGHSMVVMRLDLTLIN